MSESQQPQIPSNFGFRSLYRLVVLCIRRYQNYKASLMPVSMKVFYVLAATELVLLALYSHVDIRVVLSSLLFVGQHTLLYHIQVL